MTSLLQGAETAVIIRLAAAVVICKDSKSQDRVLVVQRSSSEKFLPGVWGVPCGKVDQSEDPSAAAVRELHEETGLTGEVIRTVGTSRFSSDWRGRPASNLQFNHLIRLVASGIRVDGEGLPKVTLPKPDQASKWIPLASLKGAGLDKHNLQTIQQALVAYKPDEDQRASSVSTSSSSRR